MKAFSFVLGILFVIAPLIAGLLLKFLPPKKINRWYGICTKATSKSQEIWDSAHKLCSFILLVYAAVSAAVYALILVLGHGYFNEHWYMRIIIGLIFALVGVGVAAALTQLKAVEMGHEDYER